MRDGWWVLKLFQLAGLWVSWDLEMHSMGVRLSYEPNQTKLSYAEGIHAFLVTIFFRFCLNGKSYIIFQQSHIFGSISSLVCKQAFSVTILDSWAQRAQREAITSGSMPSKCQLDLTWFQCSFQAFRQFVTKTEWNHSRCFMGNLEERLRKDYKTSLSPLLESWRDSPGGESRDSEVPYFPEL